MRRFLRMPASWRSPRLIMSSTPWTEVGCMALILRSGVSQDSSPSSSTTWIFLPSAATTLAPMATSNSRLEIGSIQM